MLKSRKSTTRPLSRRSQRFPRAPPRIRARPIPVVVMEWLFRHSNAETTISATIENNTSIAILHMGNAEETGNDLLAIVQRDILCDRPLGGAVEQHHQEGDQEVVPAH